MTYPLLGRIQAPGDVKRLQESELPALCEEIRQFLIESVSATGGHLSSNLGVVELTVALHRALDLPQDKILFDVGHQCYTHKLLTGRMAGFAELRQKNGPAIPSLQVMAARRCPPPSALPVPKSSKVSRAKWSSSWATAPLRAAWSTRA